MRTGDQVILKNRIKEHRGRLNMSQGVLSEFVGVDRMTIGNYETGKTTPDVVSCLLIADAFGVSIDEIFSLENQ